MDATTLATEATRYLQAVDFFRSLELNVKWRSEAGCAAPRQSGSNVRDASAAPARSYGSMGSTSVSGVNQRQREHHDVNAEAQDTPRRVRCRLTALLTGCA